MNFITQIHIIPFYTGIYNYTFLGNQLSKEKVINIDSLKNNYAWQTYIGPKEDEVLAFFKVNKNLSTICFENGTGIFLVLDYGDGYPKVQDELPKFVNDIIFYNSSGDQIKLSTFESANNVIKSNYQKKIFHDLVLIQKNKDNLLIKELLTSMQKVKHNLQTIALKNISNKKDASYLRGLNLLHSNRSYEFVHTIYLDIEKNTQDFLIYSQDLGNVYSCDEWDTIRSKSDNFKTVNIDKNYISFQENGEIEINLSWSRSSFSSEKKFANLEDILSSYYLRNFVYLQSMILSRVYLANVDMKKVSLHNLNAKDIKIINLLTQLELTKIQNHYNSDVRIEVQSLWAKLSEVNYLEAKYTLLLSELHLRRELVLEDLREMEQSRLLFISILVAIFSLITNFATLKDLVDAQMSFILWCILSGMILVVIAYLIYTHKKRKVFQI